MNKSLKVAGLCATSLLLPLIAACDSNKSKGSTDLLSYVPAESPYVLAQTQAAPEAVTEKLTPVLDEILGAYQDILRYTLDSKLAELEATEGGEEKAAQAKALTDELLGLMSLEGLEDAGIELDSKFAVYGNGLWPVFRLSLSDESSFDAAIARMEEKADKSLAVDEVDGQSFRYFDIEKARLIVATLDGYAVVTFVPSDADEAAISRALGIDLPAQNMQKAGTLRALQKEYGFQDYMTGFVDTVRVVEAVADLEIGEQLSDVCRAEILELAGAVPRVVTGYNEMTAEHLDSSVIVELRDDLAQELSKLPVQVPGLGANPGGLLSFGMSIDPKALLAFYEARLDAMEAKPFRCESFADLQAGVDQGRALLNQPIPPMVYGFRGFVANVANVEGIDFENGTPPSSIDASVLVAIENAESLVMMGAMLDPQLAALNLMPDGNPVKLELPQLAMIADQAFAAMTPDALSVSVGEGAEKNAAQLLAADGADPAPFMSVSMDSKRYYALLGEAMMTDGVSKEGEEMPKEVQEAVRDLMMASGSLYDRIKADVLFTERGIELNGRVTLGE